MSREDLNKWIEYLRKDGKVVDIKVIDYNEETNEANLLIKPVKITEKVEVDWDKFGKRETEELDLGFCENCNERAWDGRICHNCGIKDI